MKNSVTEHNKVVGWGGRRLNRSRNLFRDRIYKVAARPRRRRHSSGRAEWGQTENGNVIASRRKHARNKDRNIEHNLSTL